MARSRSRPPRPGRALRGALALAAVLPFAACRTVGFYTQGVAGQLEVMGKRRPIDEVAATTGDATLRERLELTRRVLDFAGSELRMPSGGSYESYADLGREHLVWVVYAAPELSLEPKSWWYPVVGRQDYRGFFREDLARDEARRLEDEGHEVWIAEVDAFSTLGWFRDPVLNTFIKGDEVDYVGLILHELVHRKYYVRRDTPLNEGLAEAVAREGVRRWLRHTGRPGMVADYDRYLDKLAQARREIGRTSDALRAIYASDRPDDAKRAAKAREIAALKNRLRGLRAKWGGGLRSWIEEPVNNARLNSFTTYEDQVPRFAALIRECDGDFDAFWDRVREVKAQAAE